MATDQLHDIPGNHYANANLPAHAAAAATEIVPIFKAPVACTVTAVNLIPGAAIAGADTNTTHVNLLDMGAGAGTDERAAKDYVSGVDSAVGATVALFAGAEVLAAGEKLGIEFQKVGTGLALPNWLAEIIYTPS